MKSKTQAHHLAKMMQKYLDVPQYELALPFVSLRRSKLKKLSPNDVLLLEMELLTFVLVEGEVIYADLVLRRVEERDVIVVTHLHNTAVAFNDNPKYKTLKLSLGPCQIEDLHVGKYLELSQVNLENIMLISEDQKIAEGSLVSANETLALKIHTLF